MKKGKTKTYEDLVDRYNAQLGRLDEIEELLEQLKHRFRPSLVRRRNQLKKIRDEINEELDSYEEFVTDATTFNRKTVIKFMRQFYSFYFGKELKVLSFYDNKDSKYASMAYLIVTVRDYNKLMRRFDFKKILNSREVIKYCEDDFIYLVGDKKTSFMEGLNFSSTYEQFPEIREVVEGAVSYKMNNRNLENRACLTMALDDYIVKYSKESPMEEDYNSYDNVSPLDEELRATISKTVQEVMDEEANKVKNIPAPTTSVGSATVGSKMLSMLNTMVKIDDVSDTRIIQPSSTGAVSTAKEEKKIEKVNPTIEAKKVTGVIEVPESKKTQYKAASSILLDMLDNIVTLDGNDEQHTLKK